MLIKLKGADFSGDYVEKIDIGGLESAVVTMLSHLTKYPASTQNAYAQALNTLYKGLVSDGIYSKITLLVIPLMANDMSECLYDCKTNATESSNALRTYFGLNQKNELYNSSLTPAGTLLGYQRSFNVNNVTFFGGYTKTTGSQEIRLIGGSKHVSTFSSITGVHFDSTPIGRVTLGGEAVLWQGGAMIQRAFPGGVFVLSVKSGTVIYKDATGEIQSTSSASDSETRILPLLSESGQASLAPGSCGIFGAASGLTQSEVTQLYNRINQFYSTFN